MSLRAIFLTIFLGTCYCCCSDTSDRTMSGDLVRTDVSPVTASDTKPASFGEERRIKAHLASVEHILRARDVSGLPETLRDKRQLLLDMLRGYRMNGIFPKNYDHKGKRVPCFIDKNGNICAVGYLIEQTAGRHVAEAINRKHKYDRLLATQNKTLDNWIETSGLTKEECAMIQPSYQWQPTKNENYIPPGYGIASSLIGGANIALNTVNTIQIRNGANSPAVGVMSLWVGAGSIFLGAWNYPPARDTPDNEGIRILSMVNIGLGSATLIMGICNLSANRPRKNKSLTWNVYGFQTPTKQPGIGLYLKKKI